MTTSQKNRRLASQSSSPRKQSSGASPGRRTAPWLPGAVVAISATAIVSGTLAVAPWVNDVYQVVKVTLVGFTGLAAVGAVALALSAYGVLRIRRSVASLLAIAVLLAMAIASVVVGNPIESFFGEYGRGGGWLVYAVGVVLMLLLQAELDVRRARIVATVLAGSAGAVVLYALVQVAGFEPLGAPSEGAVLSTLGQVNFVAGFSGMALPLLSWLALDDRRPTQWRLAAAVGGIGTLVMAVEAVSFQAVLSLGVGAGVLLSVVALERWPRRAVLLAATGLVVVGAAFGIAARDRVESEVRAGLDERVLMWEAGLDMAEAAPILGHGLNGYADEFGRYRSAVHASRFGPFQLADAPHNVPLSMLVSGGGVLLVLYLAFVTAVGLALVRGLRRTSGEQRLLLAAVGAAWAAYQAQSLVSIDVPTFIVWHFVTAGMVLALANAGEVRVLAVSAVVRSVGRGRFAPTVAGRALQIFTAVIILVGLVFIGRAMIADAAFAEGREASAAGQIESAVARLERATSLNPWRGEYWAPLAAARAAVGDEEGALQAGERAADHSGSASSYLLSSAQLLSRMDRAAEAERYFLLAIERSPTLSDAYLAWGEELLLRGRNNEAVRVLRRADQLEPDQVATLERLGDAYRITGDEERARQTFRRLLEVKPDSVLARTALGLDD